MILVGNDSSYIWIGLGHIFGAEGNLDPLLPCPHFFYVFSSQIVSKLTLKRHKLFFLSELTLSLCEKILKTYFKLFNRLMSFYISGISLFLIYFKFSKNKKIFI